MIIADDIAGKVLARARLKRRVPSHRDFAATIRLWGGPLKGHRYNPTSDPWQTYLLEQYDSGRWERIYDCGSAQYAGKTTIDVIVPALRSAIMRRRPVGYALPTLNDLDKAWATKLKKALDGSGYRSHLPKSGPSARGGRGPTLQFFDPDSGELEGQLVFLAGGAYGDTVADAIIDEVDQFRKADGTPLWDAIEDIFARANSYGAKAMRIACGTIEDDTQSIILVLAGDHGTGTRGWPQCPACRRHLQIGWPDVRYDAADLQTVEATARIACRNCGALWTEDDRQRALRGMRFCHKGQTVDEHGEIVGEAPRTRYLGTIRPALECTMADLPTLAKQHYLAKQAVDQRGDHALMRKFTRYVICETYSADVEELERGEELTWRKLLSRSQACAWGPTRHVTDKAGAGVGYLYSRHIAEVPPDAAFTAAGVDVQGNRVYTALVAAAIDGTTYDVAWSYEMARPDHAPWSVAELTALLDRVDLLLHQWSGNSTLALIGLDIGDWTKELTDWLRGRAGGPWRATRGKTTMKDEPGDLQGLVRSRDGVLNLEPDNLRELIHAAYRRPNGTPGAAHIPSGLTPIASDTAYLRHLVAEMRVIDERSGRPKLRQGPGRWDWQDARRIAEAMVRWHMHHKPHRRRPVKYGTISTSLGGSTE